MKKMYVEDNDTVSSPGVLPTKFITKTQTAELAEVLDHALNELHQVSGGQAANCQCVNCCSHLQ